MVYRKIKAGRGARCWGATNCPSYDPSKSMWSQRQIKRGQMAIATSEGFVCRACAPKFINFKYKELIDISKEVISNGDGEMTETIIFNLGDDVNKIIGEKA